MVTDSRPPKTDQIYFNDEMKDEFYVRYARRNATKLINKLNRLELSSKLEKHLQSRETKQIVGS